MPGAKPVTALDKASLKRMSVISPVMGIIAIVTAVFMPNGNDVCIDWALRAGFAVLGVGAFIYGWFCIDELTRRRKRIHDKTDSP
jgi:hypothetical protein